jgi:hypothetical protein
MPLSPTRLSAAIRARLLANADTAAQDNDALTAMCDEIAGAVIDEITANAVVLPQLLVAPSGGGPVTGTGTVS